MRVANNDYDIVSGRIGYNHNSFGKTVTCDATNVHYSVGGRIKYNVTHNDNSIAERLMLNATYDYDNVAGRCNCNSNNNNSLIVFFIILMRLKRCEVIECYAINFHVIVSSNIVMVLILIVLGLTLNYIRSMASDREVFMTVEPHDMAA